MKVLVADDDPMAVVLLENILKQLDYEVMSVSTGQDAIDVLTGDDPPKMAILDWVMPDISGPEVCATVRGASQDTFIYLVVLTSKSSKKDLAFALDAGADDFLSKPVEPDELRSRLAAGVRTIEYESTLREQTKVIEKYAGEMELLAEERAKQLVHSERLATIGTLTAGIVHEIANPITFVSGNISILKNFVEVAENALRKSIASGGSEVKREQLVLDELPGVLSGMEKGIENTLILMRRLKRFSGKNESEYGPSNLGDIVEETMKIARVSISKEIVLKNDVDAHLPFVMANSSQLEQVFLNLFINARDAIGQDVQGSILVRSEQLPTHVEIYVEDSGTGIPEDTIESIWEAFYTSKGIDKGTGLGLSITRTIIKEHGGEISVSNLRQGGAQFKVIFPISTEAGG